MRADDGRRKQKIYSDRLKVVLRVCRVCSAGAGPAEHESCRRGREAHREDDMPCGISDA